MFNPPSEYGIGHASPVISLADAFNSAGGGRYKVAFVNNGFTNGDIDSVISKVDSTARSAGMVTSTFTNEYELVDFCKTSLRGASRCFGAVVFRSSPKEGRDHIWNYTIRADGVFGNTLKVSKEDNDAQKYTMPLQHAVDAEISRISGSTRLPEKVICTDIIMLISQY